MNLLSGRRAARSLLLAGVIVGLGIASVGVCVALLGGGPPFPVAVALTLLPVVLGAAATTSARARRAGTAILVAASDFAGLAIAVDLGLLLMLLAFGRLPIGAQLDLVEPGAAGHAARGDLRGAAGQADGALHPRGAGGRAALARGTARRRRRPRPPHRAGGRAAAAAGRVDAPRLAAVERADLDGPAGQAGRGRPGVRDDRARPARRRPARDPARRRPSAACSPASAWPGPAGCGCGCHGWCRRRPSRRRCASRPPSTAAACSGWW